MKTLLVTGAGGYVGQALLKQLLAQGDWLIHAQLRQRSLPRELCEHPRLVLRQGDLADPAFCDALCAGVDLIIHLAGRAHTAGTRDAQWRGSHLPTRLLAEAALRHKVGKFVFLSSIKAMTPQQSPYAEVKRLQEDLLLDLHQRGLLRVVCLRPALIYGPAMRGNLATLLKMLRKPRLRLLPRPSGTMGLIGLEDCCRAIIAGLDIEALQGRSWQLDDGVRYDLADLFRRVRHQLGLTPPLLWIPRPVVFCATALAQWSAPLTGLGIGKGSYATLYLERFRPDPRYGELSGFAPRQEFYQELPRLLD
ncbi:MAG: NAD-dependent epimerase/dehydratase family protein [Pseudomonadales bacterium]|nr:NAD-dependent epimerase/dehydratase family protein [Pseudomonadales bacterium]